MKTAAILATWFPNCFIMPLKRKCRIDHNIIPSCLLPQLQNKSPCRNFLMKMSLIFMKMNFQVRLIFIRQNTIFSQLNAPGIYFKLGIVDPAFDTWSLLELFIMMQFFCINFYRQNCSNLFAALVLLICLINTSGVIENSTLGDPAFIRNQHLIKKIR